MNIAYELNINLVIICPVLIILLEIDVGEFAFIIESLPIILLNINYIQECICFDLKIRRKRCIVVSRYRTPSQSVDEFEEFSNQINLTMESVTQKNPFLTVAISNFNVRSLKWWTDDKLKKVLK